MSHKIIWTKEELEILEKKSKEGLKNSEIQKHIPNKSVDNIKRKRIALGINPRTRWTEDEVEIVRKKISEGYTPKEISDLFLKNRKPGNISWKLSQLGEGFLEIINSAETKICKKCGKRKPRVDFDFKNTKRRVCKKCGYKDHKLYIKKNHEKVDEYMQKYREDNKEKFKKLGRDYYQKNNDSRREKQRNYYFENRDSQLDWHKKYYRKNKESIRERKNEWRREKLATDGVMRLRYSFSRRFRQCLKRKNLSKERKNVFEHLDYNLGELREHLERQFYNEMSWDNYGENWEIDHRWPATKFDYKTVTDESFRWCWSLENLQPLDPKTNLIKSDRLILSHIKELSFFDKCIINYRDQLEEKL